MVMKNMDFKFKLIPFEHRIKGESVLLFCIVCLEHCFIQNFLIVCFLLHNTCKIDEFVSCQIRAGKKGGRGKGSKKRREGRSKGEGKVDGVVE